MFDPHSAVCSALFVNTRLIGHAISESSHGSLFFTLCNQSCNHIHIHIPPGGSIFSSICTSSRQRASQAGCERSTVALSHYSLCISVTHQWCSLCPKVGARWWIISLPGFELHKTETDSVNQRKPVSSANFHTGTSERPDDEWVPRPPEWDDEAQSASLWASCEHICLLFDITKI